MVGSYVVFYLVYLFGNNNKTSRQIFLSIFGKLFTAHFTDTLILGQIKNDLLCLKVCSDLLLVAEPAEPSADRVIVSFFYSLVEGRGVVG